MPRTDASVGHRHYTQEKGKLIDRLKRIEGQARGVQKMIEDERYCIDIVQQLSSISSATDEVALAVLQDHIEGCVSDAIRERRGEEYVKELMVTIRKAMKR